MASRYSLRRMYDYSINFLHSHVIYYMPRVSKICYARSFFQCNTLYAIYICNVAYIYIRECAPCHVYIYIYNIYNMIYIYIYIYWSERFPSRKCHGICCPWAWVRWGSDRRKIILQEKSCRNQPMIWTAISFLQMSHTISPLWLIINVRHNATPVGYNAIPCGR